jgi:hypothetical protein
MKTDKRKFIKKLVRKLLENTTSEMVQEDVRNMWFSYKPNKEELERLSRPRLEIRLYGKLLQHDDILKTHIPWELREIFNKEMALRGGDMLYQLWNDYRQILIYLHYSKVKKKKYRQRRELFNYYIS